MPMPRRPKPRRAGGGAPSPALFICLVLVAALAGLAVTTMFNRPEVERDDSDPWAWHDDRPVRHGLNPGPGILREAHDEEFARRFGLGFSAQDREENIRRVGGVESKVVDVRLLAATNVDLWKEVEQGRFREDLYYRLNVINIELPPLRDRKEDIALLAAHFLKLYAEENERDVTGFSPQAMDAFSDYSWPGNVRELQNAVERAVVLCRADTIEVDELPQALRGSSSAAFPTEELPPEGVDFREAVAAYQSHIIREALRRSGGVQRRAARMLKLSPTTLNEMVHRLGISGNSDDRRSGR